MNRRLVLKWYCIQRHSANYALNPKINKEQEQEQEEIRE